MLENNDFGGYTDDADESGIEESVETDEEEWDMDFPENTDLGEVWTVWKEDGEIEVNYGLIRGKKGSLLPREAAPELSDEALSSWDVFLRYRDGKVEVLFGNMAKRTFLPDDNPLYYDDPISDF